MAQITVYLPDDVAQKARDSARRANKSLSAFIGELLTRETVPRTWSSGFADLLRKGTAELVEPPDPPPEDVAPLD